MALTFRSSRFSIHVWAGIAYNLKTSLFVLPLAPRKKRLGSDNQWDPAEAHSCQTQEDPPASPVLNPIENIRFVIPLSSGSDELSTGDPSHAQQEKACWMWHGKLPWND
ncbi:hypothetical protein NDA11_005954 [Ustilago hordei]|uniref:Uncharacterized protein n=1 Tax=Ustilago hordei TaxID=120017 RepID=I2G147_USTHO|nr:uncharacterized protein UHO2_03328 [Ustilago hordei]KAJ1041009.1 hypothetical protein NDA10_007524 [Ustilago hordei]KAJ1580956.1 hypothetical protein NDA15_001442 [Ustilago hordei]KAJ1582635.1 hypothetical protein NDA12_000075 [Ustilago hordei]KAJ1588764.1 hypothetical protein NDA11_005954 [Ustilago hordei]KAJ1599743.1 hypothetical protein NDA14_001622 [Ustilago hordei]